MLKHQITRRGFLKIAGVSACATGLSSSLFQSCTTKDVAKFIEALTELAVLINDEREKNGLSRIKLSSGMMSVAMHHVMDLNANAPITNCKSIDLHAWSGNGGWNGENGKGAWKGCCYSADPQNNTKCMWDKPKEIADYPGNGYEIAHWSSGKATPQGALNSWLSSTKGHRDVILNKNVWSSFKWEALGAACGGNYACAWFGTVKA